MTKRIDDLIQTICGPNDHPIKPFLEHWCSESRPFLAFAETYATKIRKKARLRTGEDLVAELLAELALAARLANDRRCTVEYEPYASTGQRGPDLKVIFRTHTPFNVEVTRLRALNAPTQDDANGPIKLGRVVCDKLGQFPPGVINVLAVVLPPGAADAELAPTAIRLLDEHAQRQDDTFFRERKLDGIRAYIRQRQRMSAIAILVFDTDWSSYSSTIWLNPTTKHPLPPEIARLFVQAP